MGKIRLAPGVWTNSVGILLGGSGAVTGATAQHTWVQILGWGGMALGLALLLWGILIDGEHWWKRVGPWLSRHVWWRFGRSPLDNIGPNAAPPDPRKTKASSPVRVEEWIPLHQALHYLVYDSFWARKQAQPQTEDAFNQLVSAEIRERLARGEVRARGAKGVAFSDDGKPTEEIPATYWVDGFILPHGLIAIAEEKQDAAGNPQQKHTYRRVIVNRNDLISAWPQSGMGGLSPLAAFVEPLRKRIENERAASASEPPAPLPRPSFEVPAQDEFPPYPVVVLKAQIGSASGTRDAREGKPFRAAVHLTIRNDHAKILQDCSILVASLTKNGADCGVTGVLSVGRQRTFKVQPGHPISFVFLSRDMSDEILPAPWLLRLFERDLPLEESSQYIMRLELRSKYPRPTIAHVQVDTGQGLDVRATVIGQELGEPYGQE